MGDASGWRDKVKRTINSQGTSVSKSGRNAAAEVVVMGRRMVQVDKNVQKIRTQCGYRIAGRCESKEGNRGDSGLVRSRTARRWSIS